MQDINDCNFTGHLTSDPEMKVVGDTAVLNFRIAINGYKDSASFLSCQVWGKYAESLARVLVKGQFVAVHGELQTYEYTGSNGRQFGQRLRTDRVVHPNKPKVDRPEETTLDAQINGDDLSTVEL
jgi:single-stranded DNA-binding protein